MTSSTGTCSVNYDQAGSPAFNAAPQVVEAVSAQKANQTIAVSSHAPSSAVFGSSFSVAAIGPRRCRDLLELGCVLELGLDVHDDERHRDVLGEVRPGGQRDLQRRAAGGRGCDCAEGRPGDRGFVARAVVGRFRLELLGGGDRAGWCGDVLELCACSNSGSTFTMTSGTGTCSVGYDQAGGANYNAAPQVVEAVERAEGRSGDRGFVACARRRRSARASPLRRPPRAVRCPSRARVPARTRGRRSR